MNYTGFMHERQLLDARCALRTWQNRQKADGCLITALAVLSTFQVLQFLSTPIPAGAFVLGLCLFALAVACLRLLHAAAMVVRARNVLQAGWVEDLVDAGLLDSAGPLISAQKPLTLRLSADFAAFQTNRSPDRDSGLLSLRRDREHYRRPPGLENN